MRLATLVRALATRPGHCPLLVEAFVGANLAFLVLDIYAAHSVNQFRHWAEWIPFGFAAAGAAAVFGTLGLRRERFHLGWGWWAGIVVGALSIAVGVAGLLWHLESQFFRMTTLRSLVYSAPFLAPLAFAGLGFLLLLGRMVPHESAEWGWWVVLLALGGFVGNFGLSLVDHAQNGFFYPAEWISVGVSALAVGYLVVLVLFEPLTRVYLLFGGIVLGLQAAAGVLGFGLHVRPVLEPSLAGIADRVIYGAPVFAPLLFVDLAVLAGLGVWDLWAKARAG